MIPGIKWGCINTAREYVIPPIFDNIFGFRNGYSVFEKSRKCGIIDLFGNIVVDADFDAIDCPDDSGVSPALVGTKWGYYDLLLKEWVIPPSFDFALRFGNGRAFVGIGDNNNNWKYGIIDRRGHFIVEPKWDDVMPSGFGDSVPWVADKSNKYVIDFNGNYLHGPYRRIIAGSMNDPLYVESASFSGLITADGKHIIEGKNWTAVSWFQCGVIVVRTQQGEFAIVDIAGNIKKIPQCKYMWRFSEGVAAFVSGEKVGIIDTDGNIKVDTIFEGPLEFDLQQWMSAGLIGVKKNGLWGFVDKSGNVRIDFRYQQVRPFSCGLATVSVKEND